jgi:hypothetical protein
MLQRLRSSRYSLNRREQGIRIANTLQSLAKEYLAMSDQPLFQNMDEQEAVYGGQQTGGDDDAQNANTDDVGVPGAGAGLLGTTGGGATGGIIGGSPAATDAVVGATEPEDETRGDHSV